MKKLSISAVALVSVLGMNGEAQANFFSMNRLSPFCQNGCSAMACDSLATAKRCAGECGGPEDKSIEHCIAAAKNSGIKAIDKHLSTIGEWTLNDQGGMKQKLKEGKISDMEFGSVLTSLVEIRKILDDLKAIMPAESAH